jgi:hypothetical protein
MSRLIKLIFRKYSLEKTLKYCILYLDRFPGIDGDTQYFMSQLRKILLETIIEIDKIKGLGAK